MNLFKSKLYREEIKHWIAIVALSLCTLISTVCALRNEPKTLVIGIDEAGSRIISDSKDRLIQIELKQFIKYFLDQYYTYNQNTFSERIGLATELMTKDLWEKEKDKLFDLKLKLDQTALSQFSELESIDLIDQNKIEAILKLKVKSRMSEQSLRLKVVIVFKKQERSETNPWNFSVAELSDATL